MRDERTSDAGLWEKIWERQNLLIAMKRVESNGGAPGIDGMMAKELRPYLKEHWLETRAALESGVYRPNPVRRVEIAKPDGGVRQLGHPEGTDRFLQQAISQVLVPLFEPLFSDPASASAVRTMEKSVNGIRIDTPVAERIAWHGAASVDGQPWPAWDGETVWVPAGVHTIGPGEAAGPRLLWLNGELKSARASGTAEIEFTYESGGGAIAILDRHVRWVRVDGVPGPVRAAGPNTVLLPRGQHVVTMGTD